MGMAASQARLLSITARLSNNEQSSESVAYSKQRLADQTQQITNEYNEALDATKLTVLTGFNGAVANYEDISYNLMTGLHMAESTRQYVVTDTKGRILVTENIANAYVKSHGNYNQFLANLGAAEGGPYSQADITAQISDRKYYDAAGNETTVLSEAVSRDSKTAAVEQQIHEAWDKYFASVGINKFMPEHDFGFSFTETYAYGTDGSDPQNHYSIGDGYVGFIRTKTDENGKIKYQPVNINAGKDGLDPEWVDDLDAPYYVDKYGNQTTGFTAYSANITADENNYVVYYDSDGQKLEKDTYSTDITGNTEYTLRYVDSDENIVDYDVDNDGDGINDSYSTNITDSEDYILRYVDSSNTIVDYDDYSEETKNLISDEKWFDAQDKEISKDTYIYDPINYEGTTQESRDLYDYAMAITEAYFRVNVNGTSESGAAYKKQYVLNEFNSAANSENNNAIKYYKNIFNKIQANGFFTYTETAQNAKDDGEHYIYSEERKGTNKIAKNPLKDNYTFEAALRDGSLRLQFYSNTEKTFKSTTISEDNCIQEVKDERAIAKAETKYNQDMADLENKDKKFDLQLKKLDTEHKALETEYESVKNVVDKNVESTFKIFS